MSHDACCAEPFGAAAFAQLPKVELHLHLEGAIPVPSLWELVRKYGGAPEVPSEQALRERFRYRSFGQFLRTWTWKNRFLREYDDFELVARAVAADLAAQQVRYAEASFSPSDFARRGLRIGRLAEAIRSGLAQVPEVDVALLGDLVRNRGPELGSRQVHELAELNDLGVIGVGLGGSELEFPPQPWAECFTLARSSGLHTTVHAGEGAGPPSVWGAIDALRPERIGHGTRAVEDPALLDALLRRRIPIEMCPGSNVCTAVVPTLADHPIGRLYRAGFALSVNTDDPKMFGTSLSQEYAGLCATQGLGPDDIRALILAAVQHSFLSPARKATLCAELRADPGWMSV